MSAEYTFPMPEAFLEALARRTAEMLNSEQRERVGWLNFISAAKYLDVTEQALRARVKRHEVPVHRRDGRLYFSPAELDDYVRGEAA
jgi:Helix-turn-helix domain